MASTHLLLLLVSLVLAQTRTEDTKVPPPAPLAMPILPPEVPAPPVDPSAPPAKPSSPPPTAAAPPVTDVPTPPPPAKPSAPPTKPYPPPTKPPTPALAPPQKAPVPPTPYRPPVKKEECAPLCEQRCILQSRKKLCVRACSTCCARCKCVPPGTYGNRELCGKCYTDMTTHGNRIKCP
ncbi:hypothetical protein Dimus_011296 [Dionaea muscipula]